MTESSESRDGAIGSIDPGSIDPLDPAENEGLYSQALCPGR
jgi:hypothetical protein